ncbi:e8679990-bd5e-40c7-a6c3-f2e7f1fc801a [Sclerotinia trifoliorum]|uniref:E8679990-bd5e-40c7-a6c3-f2e7f1fc801a n=1 Tax=Sclerotinia trifoliorum TaxID=28548 RepID=A0A8H2VVW8_9HELO|nr:e8679990-bd5e-40c7-a6c3-f2e7f1fc801a [Sclerotinia trifoliorum]
MALEPSSGRKSVSPASSGRASPVSRKWRNQLGGDEPPNKDKAFRRYASGVDRSLSLFDTALQEWADYISFLGRLLKSLQAHPANIAAVPSKAIVAKRLAQCLNPSLPSGVHQKALEVYGYIFSMVGTDELSKDLPLYLPGLSTTLSFASLSVRGPFLELLEKHILRVDGRSLRPALKAIILALLPGLEEENSDEFERTLKLLDGFKHAVRPSGTEDLGQNHSSGDEYFWQCFFLAAITSNGRRLGALAYLNRNLPTLGHSPSEQSTSSSNGPHNDVATNQSQLAEIVTSPEPGLLLRCFAAGLADEQILIQRGFLDLLVTHLPLHSNVLQQRVKSEDLELLVTAAAGVVTRRDMSLNRRLWTWLLGPEPAGHDNENGPESPTSLTGDHLGSHASSRTQYFENYGLHPLTQALLKLIGREAVNPIEKARPFRICLSLMDRWEIGGLVVPDIFLSVVTSVRGYKSKAANKADFAEVLRSASVFFDGVESGLIWGEIVGLIAQALAPGKLSTEEQIDKLSLVTFIINHFNVREEEMLLIHAPLATLTILSMLEDAKERTQERAEKAGVASEVEKLALNLVMDLSDLIPERAFQLRPPTGQSMAKHDDDEFRHLSNTEIIRNMKTFYVEEQGNLDAFPPPFSTRDLSELLVRESGSIANQSLSSSVSSADAGVKTRLLIMLLAKVPKVRSLDVSGLLKSMQSKLSIPSQLPFLAFTSIMSLCTSLYSNHYISLPQLSSLVDPLVRLAWSYLSATHPKYHVETVRSLWQLQTTLTLDNHDIEASICNLMIEHDLNGTYASRDADHGRSFSILWTHSLQDNAGHLDRRSSNNDIKNTPRLSGIGNYEVMLARPLFLLLDALVDERTQLFMTVRIWLQSLVGIDRLFHIFVAKFSSYSFLYTNFEDAGTTAHHNMRIYTDEDDLDQCLYHLQTLSNVLRWSSDTTWAALAHNSISTDRSHRSLFQITGRDEEITLLEFFLYVCLQAISGTYEPENSERKPHIHQFHRTALTLLHQILLSPYSLSLGELQLEHVLIQRLSHSLTGADPFIQVLLLDVVYAALKIRPIINPPPPSPTLKKRSTTMTSTMTQHDNASVSSLGIDQGEHTGPFLPPPPPSLVKCLQAGFEATSSRPVLDSWVSFLTECLPFYSETIFQILIPLVGTLCAQIELTFTNLQTTFKEPGMASEGFAAPESTLISLLNGLEFVLAKGHDRLLKDETKAPIAKSPDQPQGFFGNMVSGVFNSETPQARSITANNRLTVLLSFQDAVRICFLIWSWGGQDGAQDSESTASFNYTSLRMRNRARRLLEHLFTAEALECLETLVQIGKKSSNDNDPRPIIIFNLLHVLDGSRPKHTIPAIFNAIYSRTNPNALDPSRKSTLTSPLSDTDLVTFLVEYARSLEDDAMDEIWVDCMTFLKDLLANPFPHRQTLPSLLEFAAILGVKVDNTNFGEQRRMRRELGDLFLRLLTAMFTTRPMGFSESVEKLTEFDQRSSSSRSSTRSDDVVRILASIAPNLPKVLVENDRILNAANTISSSVIGPTFKSRSFPDNVSKSTLELLYQLSRLPNTQKSWRKDLGDAFNDSRFFANNINLVESDWLPLLRQWTLSDKERMPEFLSRLVAPSTAGIVFGVGATSARFEADRKSQLNLRRIATLVLATMDDNFVTDLPLIQEKIVELLSATTTSSPSSTTRADIYLLLRALVLKTSAIHLATLWPIINAELHVAISSVVAPDHSTPSDTYNNYSILQACKLLDTLLCIAPDDFQLHEWLFITDTIDAVYRPSSFRPVSLVDELSEELGLAATTNTTALQESSSVAVSQAGKYSMRRPLLGRMKGGYGINDEGTWERKDELVAKVLRPFFSQLSIFAFESTYGMGATDWEACRQGLLRDLFDERTIVKAL